MTEPDRDIHSLTLALRALYLGDEHHRRSVAKSLGISTTELALLSYLHRAGQLTPREIGDRLGITTGSTTALVDRIERAGLVVRSPNPRDRRSLYLSLTPAGLRAMQWVLEQYEAQVESALATLDRATLDLAAGVIAEVGRALEAAPLSLDYLSAG